MSRTPMLTDRQIDLMQHALGVSEENGAYRNYFAAGAADAPDWDCLVAGGFARFNGAKPQIYGDLRFYSVTVHGRRIVNERLAAKLRKLTPGQRRYRQFLRADSGLSFGEWLKARRQAKEIQ